MQLIFRPHQDRMYRFLAQRWAQRTLRVNLWAGMGSGKTVTVLTLLDAMYNLAGEKAPTLVLGPLRVVRSTWPGEIKQWDHLRGLSYSVITGTADERRAALRRKAAVYMVNYDNLVWLFDELRGVWPFETVVADESTRLKNFRIMQGGVRAQKLGQIAHRRVRNWINLTGTPAPNGLIDLWGQQWFVDKGAALGASFSAFENRWFAWKRREGDDYAKQQFPLEHAKEDIEARLRPCTLAIDNALQVDAPIENIIRVDLPRAAAAKYREMEREMFIELEEVGVEAFNAAGLTMKCLQLANGAVYPNEGGAAAAVEVHDAKLDALASVIEEAAGMPVLVAYHFKADLARLQRAFPRGRHLDANPRTIDDWNAGRIPLLFAHPASAGHGLNLQHGGNILVFFGLWWDLEPHEQIIERIGPTRQKQSGYDRPVFVHYLLAKGTIDEVVYRRLKTKASMQDSLRQAMEDRR